MNPPTTETAARLYSSRIPLDPTQLIPTAVRVQHDNCSKPIALQYAPCESKSTSELGVRFYELMSGDRSTGFGRELFRGTVDIDNAQFHPTVPPRPEFDRYLAAVSDAAVIEAASDALERYWYVTLKEFPELAKGAYLLPVSYGSVFLYDEEFPCFLDEEGTFDSPSDEYCVVPGCACREVNLLFSTIEKERHESIGELVVHYDSGAVVWFAPRDGHSETLRRLWDQTLETHGAGTLLSRFRARHEKMRKAPQVLPSSVTPVDENWVARMESMSDPDELIDWIQEKCTPTAGQTYSISFPIPQIGTPPLLEPRRKVGRNQPCPCGSGKKYKRCCG
ncbi:MAG: SEC-C metal-binding domain-containing protein [Planctomycetota bacterium]